MVNWRAVFLIGLLFVLFQPGNAHAKSYSIDRVQIKGWVQPNGDMVVNEVFTYTLDGSFSTLKRSFPDRHVHQIESFEAYWVTGQNPVVGEIDKTTLVPLESTKKNETMVTSLENQRDTMNVLYVYRMKQAVVSYESYSSLDITYFENGKNHNKDLHEVSIAYVLPGAVGDGNIHGGLAATINTPQVYEDGIIFSVPVSKARTLAETKVLYPSVIMTDQFKNPDPQSFESAIQSQSKWLANIEQREDSISVIITIANWLIITLVLASLVILMMRQKVIGWKMDREKLLHIDPLYLFFIHTNGNPHRKSILAGLFSLVEKGRVQMVTEPSAERFRERKDMPSETLAFYVVPTPKPIAPVEQRLINFLFKTGMSRRKFHLHDIGLLNAIKGKRHSNQSMIRFDAKRREWEWEVVKLMEEAGALTTKWPNYLKRSLLICGGLFFSLVSWMILDSFWYAIIAITLTAIPLWTFWKSPLERIPPIFYFATMAIFIYTLPFYHMRIVCFALLAAIAFLFYVTPFHIVGSWRALRYKWGVNYFRYWSMNPPPEWSNDDIERYERRMYLVKPVISRVRPFTAWPILSTDPLSFLPIEHHVWGQDESWLGGGSNNSSVGDTSSSSGSGGGDGGGAGAE
ncbi:hypothetical protein NCCP2222_11890 [Sporosarcina sp. NCCP-2222]|uniref:DUF2207 domain-containing protein n=1 Tax=Sporosarcina sp. NCCP-2222 TaxID=2935073 RepID=UPI0020870B75|nr:DUF2207 domain-containing protein [Sporosarcina sp. NCCP-2222]GKV55242.1 hypothetical protein NCCP2222_11890 [Sporosarcina sp. NCCP-2222]